MVTQYNRLRTLPTILRHMPGTIKRYESRSRLVCDCFCGAWVAASRPLAVGMAFCGEGILPLLFRNEGLWPSDRGQDARDTQGRDALAT